MELDFEKFQLIINFGMAFAIVVLMQTSIFVPLILVLGIYLAGVTLDNVSTYFCAKMVGMMHFFYMERNTGAKNCVKKYGLIWGLIATEFRPRKIFCECLLIISFGLVTISFAKNTGFLIPGLLFIGSQRIYAGLNNLNVIREDYKLYHPNKLIIEEEQ